MEKQKYKLLKWYPSLNKKWKCLLDKNEEVVVEQVEDFFILPRAEGCSIRLKYNEVTCNPEFWEKVVKKEYKILSFKCVSGYIFVEGAGTEWVNIERKPKLGSTYESLLKNTSIYKIKRLADDKIFTVGDKVDSTISDLGRATDITGFKIIDNKLKVGLRHLGYYSLSTIILPKEPLFTTEDGYEVFEGDKVTSVCKEDLRISGTYLTTSINKENQIWDGSDGYLQFSTKEAAKEWILMHKPCLSINDVLCLKGFEFPYWEDKLKNIVKLKSNE